MSAQSWRELGGALVGAADYRIALDDAFGAILREQMLPEAPADGPTAVGVSDTASLASTETPAVLVSVGVTDTASLSAADIATLFASGFYSASDTASLSASEVAAVVATDAQAAPEAISGGFFYWYERDRRLAARRRRELEEAEEEAKRIQDEVDREIAERLQRLEREEVERQEVQRLADLAAKYSQERDAQEFSDRVLKAVIRANATQSAAALAQLRFEIERQLEDEEVALLLIFNQ